MNQNQGLKLAQSLKQLKQNNKNNSRTMTFYKSINLKTIKPYYRVQSQQKKIQIEKNPWSNLINQSQVSILLKRLNDTPAILYTAIQKQNKQNQPMNNNKFKPINHLSLYNKSQQKLKLNSRFLSKTQKNTKRQNLQILQKNISKTTKKSLQQAKETKIMNKIQAAKKKYVEEYRKMLLGMKAISLDTDLPRIKYVQQNQTCNRINIMHAGIKL